MTRTQSLVLTAAAASAAVTAVVTVTPSLRFAYRGLELHIVVQTSEALIGLLAGYLVLGRSRRSRRLDDVLLALAFAALALTNLAFGAIPMVVGEHTSPIANWSAMTGRVLGAALLAAAAFAPSTRVRLSGRGGAAAGLAMLAVLATVAVAAAALEPLLPGTVDVTAEDSSRPDLSGHWAVLAGQLIGVVLFALAAAGFTRRADQHGDELFRWLAVAAVFAATARVNYFLYPSLFTEWVYFGDIFRLLFYLVVLWAALNEISAYWRNYADVAAYEERRRIARDLHDGLAQELASIRRNLSWLDEDDRFVRRAWQSADRALIGSRRAIAALNDRSRDRADVALGEVARQVAQREGIQVILSLDPGVELGPRELDAVLLIASEAITNAAKHGGANSVRVELSKKRRVTLRVVDSGRGFDPARSTASADGGLGLRGMRERAEGIGARLRVRSRPNEGTEVEVVL